MNPEQEKRVARILSNGISEHGCTIGGDTALAAHGLLDRESLSIIDIEGGKQPMTNEDQSLWLTFNGEIFNYVELRAELERRGHMFATKSDTEVVLHLYEEKGEACVHELNGQWEFALWDGRRRRLFVSRDRVGVRPLFFAFAQNQFLFASEVKALFAHPSVARELDPQALDQIFTFWAPLAPRTVFKNVSELPPGHAAVRFARAYAGKGTATIVGSNVLAGPIEAALANGVLAHSDETDDSHNASQSHPGSPIVPAALAVGEEFGVDGTRLLRAVTLGYDVGPRVTM